ncbi:MAG: hypothetical protein K6343_02925 [Caldisericaceae bacterium]
MVERDVLNAIKSFEEEGERVLKEAESTVRALKEELNEKKVALRKLYENNFLKEVENYRSSALKLLDEEAKKIESENKQFLKLLEEKATEKIDKIIVNYLKEVVDYVNREA